MTFTRALFDGLRVGLLGGSFNPAHEGHREISLTALRLLQLDFVWWLVTPGNPQKDSASYAAFEARMAAAKRCADHPRILISDFEREHGLSYSAGTIEALLTRFPATKFVWMIGADNLTSFHTWRNWQRIAASLPLAIFNRPGHDISALSAPAAQALEPYRLPVSRARSLAGRKAPAWVYFNRTQNISSSTAIRDSDPAWQAKLPA